MRLDMTDLHRQSPLVCPVRPHPNGSRLQFSGWIKFHHRGGSNKNKSYKLVELSWGRLGLASLKLFLLKNVNSAESTPNEAQSIPDHKRRRPQRNSISPTNSASPRPSPWRLSPEMESAVCINDSSYAEKVFDSPSPKHGYTCEEERKVV